MSIGIEYRVPSFANLVRFNCSSGCLCKTNTLDIDQFLPQAKKFPYTHFLTLAVVNHLRVVNWPVNLSSLGPNFSLNGIKGGKGGPFEALVDSLSLRVLEDDSVIEPETQQVPQIQIQQWSQGSLNCLFLIFRLH